MPYNYTINADIIDIRNDIPKEQDIILVDSNVWYWLTYTRASQSTTGPNAYQINTYPSYIAMALSAKSKLLWSGLSFAELAHRIEQVEREIYNATNSMNVNTKEFRHNLPNERNNVTSQIEAAWAQVKSMGSSLENLIIDAQTTDEALINIKTQAMDGYDLFITSSLMRQGHVKVLTDDGDYSNVPGIQVFTGNRGVIRSARTQGKIVVR
ncbi:hypothetical protein KP806_07660 [Paenibacillus sp. N4]|uniref:hypothetical protein n=1 Tax=Paenibacillus vietnamensis TaxID=2590547 RepID=UPI001CD054A3|nr:hypothetical protein [Paenibacillus vietnamensis]MCA0754923.1 hypothetical protein [Paenibacillus vietnamensis]